MKTHCATCGKSLVQEPGESNANRRRRKTCKTKTCLKPYRQKLNRNAYVRQKLRDAGKEPHKRRFKGKVTQAFKDFLQGAKHG